jgi:hypothetical protein
MRKNISAKPDYIIYLNKRNNMWNIANDKGNSRTFFQKYFPDVETALTFLKGAINSRPDDVVAVYRNGKESRRYRVGGPDISQQTNKRSADPEFDMFGGS